MAFFTGGQHPRCAERLLVRFLPRLNFVPRLNLSLRQNKNLSFPGHAPGKDTLRAANAATKEGVNGGRKRVKRKRLPVVVPVKIKFPVASADMCRHSDTLRGAQRRRKRGLRGENRISVSEFCCLPVLLLSLSDFFLNLQRDLLCRLRRNRLGKQLEKRAV